MNRDRLIQELPAGLATALRLHESGEPDSVVAAALAVPEESVPVLIQVAQAKLEHLIDGTEDPVDCNAAADGGQCGQCPETSSESLS